MIATHDDNVPIVYWHRDLPPLDAELVAEHTVEASSSRVSGTLAHRDGLWDQCYQDLMTNTTNRLVEEVARLGGHHAHVHDETISPKHDAAEQGRALPARAVGKAGQSRLRTAAKQVHRARAVSGKIDAMESDRPYLTGS